ncbi:hypothetical protein FACS1894201_05390 [Bacteroidia bacterium]|nr:hypothetical protein FACS1894201_05390 [Bacteroidia bacterium]
MRESDMLSKKHAIYVSTTNGTILSSSGDGKSYSIICNFPNSAKRWKIPKQGLKVIISGQYYPYDGIVPTDRTRAYLELTSLKIANE